MRRVLMIMAAAGFLAAAAPAQAALVNEAPASSWQTDGKVNAIVVGNGKIYIGGSFTHVRAPGAPAGGAVRNHLAALNVHTGALLPWNPGANDIVNALALKPNGKTIYAGGHFTQVHGAARLHVAAINASSSTLRPWKANANGKVDVIKATRSARLHRRGLSRRSRVRPATGWAPSRPPPRRRSSTGGPMPAPRSTRFSSLRRASASTSAVPSTT